RWPFGYGHQRRRGWWPYVNYWGMNYWGTTGPLSQTTFEIPKTAGPVGRVSRSESVLDFAQQGRLALRSDDPLHRCAALEQNHRRDRDHLEIPGGLRVGIHVELGDLQRAGLLVGDLLQHRRHHLARTAPVGPEIHQNRCVAVQYVGLEGAVGDGDGATH